MMARKLFEDKARMSKTLAKRSNEEGMSDSRITIERSDMEVSVLKNDANRP